MTKKAPELAELQELFRDGLRKASTNPSIHGYIPHEKQVTFHSSPAKGRLYIGGNRSGKTVGGIVEDVWRLLGKHPFQRTTPPPVKGRIVTVSYTEGIQQIIIPELQRWIPPSMLKNGSWEDSYEKQLRTLTLTNGSTIELMSYDQDLEKFAGTSRDFVHFDEEPPKSIFTECKMRLLDRHGFWYITMTPVEGMTWVYDEVYLPGLSPANKSIEVVSIDTSENPHISNEELEEVIKDLDDDEKKARKKGEFVSIGGRVFKSFTERHIIPPVGSSDKFTWEQIQHWTHYCSLDHGFNNPTCWLWHAVSPNGLVVTYDEIYQNETIIPEFARLIKERNALEGRKPPAIYVGDPSITQRSANTGDSVQVTYANLGIPIVLGNNDVKIGVEKMNRYLHTGKWLITESCPNLVREMFRVRWKIFESAKLRHDNNKREEIHKHNDHAPDSARYMFSLMPDLHLPQAIDNTVEEINKSVKELIAPKTTYERRLARVKRGTSWRHINDEHMGGIW